MKIAICGPGRVGKDVVAEYLSSRHKFVYAGSTSVVISREVARREGITFEEAHAQRHDRRDDWFRIGNELRAIDKARLAREVLCDGDLCVGVRDYDEMAAVRDEELVDLAIWVDRPVPFDPTLKYTSALCDIILPNHGTLADLYRRLDRLAKTWRLTR